MKFAVLADAHIGRSIPLAIAEHRRQAFENAFSKTINSIIKFNVEYVFICGDLFERRTLRPKMVQFVHDELYRLAIELEKNHGKKVKILVIRGNHDGRPESDTLDYLKHPLAEYLHLFSDSDPIYADDKITVIGLNYHDKLERAYNEVIKPLIKELKGLKIFLVHGFIASYNNVPPYSSSLTLDDLSEANFDYIFTGHYHKMCSPRKLPSGGWVLTPGSLEIYDFAETPDKGYYIVDSNKQEFHWIPIEPYHLMKQVNIDGDKSRPPSWYEEKIIEVIMDFINELRSTKKEGYLRIKVRGKLSEGWPSDINNEYISELTQSEPNFLWFDIDTMDLEIPKETQIIKKDIADISEYFLELGDFTEVINEMHLKTRETLEEEASTLTGLLTSTQRIPLIQDWLKFFEEKKFKVEKP
ncbi:metallophosphoesterase family protein [Candidatus Bathyarchaeota archaeon]|nr:metallophosphoesterase family protein [Candidatus Bathyarchaeota archaeon]